MKTMPVASEANSRDALACVNHTQIILATQTNTHDDEPMYVPTYVCKSVYLGQTLVCVFNYCSMYECVLIIKV